MMNRVFQNDEQNEFFKKNGYAVFPNFLNEHQVQELKNLILEHPDMGEGFHRSLDSYDEDYKKFISDRIDQVITPVSQKYLDNYRFLLVSTMMKEPGEDTTFEVHQNWNFVEEDQYHSLAIWVPLVDVNAQNGTMHVVEGSHRLFPTFRGGPEIPSIYRNIYPYIKEKYMKPIDLSAGDALIIDDAILHYTSPNMGHHTRIALAQVMIPKAAQPIYYYQKYGDDRAPIQQYDIDDDFYLYFNNRYNPTAPPHDCELTNQFRTSLQPVTETEFDELMAGKSSREFKKESISHETIPMKTKMNDPVDTPKPTNEKKGFFQVYTPKNIVKEISHRVGLYDTLFGEQEPTPKEVSPIEEAKRLVPDYPEEQHPSKVGEFYNEQHDAFIQVYGNVIQAFRTKDVDTLLNQQIDSIGIEDNMSILDAGCGICAPAIHFASKRDVSIDAMTISSKQAGVARQHIAEKNLGHKITVHHADYHLMNEKFEDNTFDKVYFLESFGHSHDKKKLLESVWDVLKPGGQVYIKDLFRKIAHHKILQSRIDKEIDKINDAYRYRVADLNLILDIVRKKGFIIEYIRTIDLPLSEFEDLAISNEFQELTGIGKIENWAEYIFPIDFFEIRLMKPHFDLSAGTDRYFLQNLYRVQIENWKEDEL